MGALVNHSDLCVSSLARSLPFHRDLLATWATAGRARSRASAAEVVHYLGGPAGSVGLRERQSPGSADRYRVGVHHLAFDAPSRAVVDAAATGGAGPARRSTVGTASATTRPWYYAVFFLDPDALKLGVVHQRG